MGTKFTHGVRTTANRTAWVQTGFTPEQAEAEASRLNTLGTLPDVEYVSDMVCSHPTEQLRGSVYRDEEGVHHNVTWCHRCGDELRDEPQR
jgi:hypothetical protein